MLGWLSFGVDECPVANADGFIPITNTTIRESKEYFCTGPGEGGRHVIGIHATGCFDAQNRYAPCFAMADGSSVNGLPEDFEIPNPAGSTNLVREARGYYRLWVRHFDFEDGPVLEGVARRGCVSHGQWRRFSLVGYASRDSSLSRSLLEHALPYMAGPPFLIWQVHDGRGAAVRGGARLRRELAAAAGHADLCTVRAHEQAARRHPNPPRSATTFTAASPPAYCSAPSAHARHLAGRPRARYSTARRARRSLCSR